MHESNELDAIPNEVWHIILSYLHKKYIPSLRLVSKSFYALVTHYFYNFKHNFKCKVIKFEGELLQYVENNLKHMKSLKTLTLDITIPLGDEEWQSISKLNNLENISVIRCTNDRWLQSISNAANLKYVQFEESHVNNFDRFTNLETLIINDENIDDDSVPILLPNSLKQFTCTGKLDSKKVESIIIACHNLQQLKINCNELDDKLFERILINLNHLVSLKLLTFKYFLTPQMYSVFARNDIQFKLTKLRIPWFLSEENSECQNSLKYLSTALQNLSIDFTGNASLADCKVFLKTINNLKNLCKLSLNTESVSDYSNSSEEDFPILSLPKLVKFKCVYLDNDWSNFVKCFLQPSLKTLILHNRVAYTIYEIDIEKYSFKLENLKLIGTFKFITDFIIDRTDFPTQFSNLVSLEGDEITDEFLPYLNGQLLQKLEIYGTFRLHYFEKFTKLKDLSIQFSTNDFKDLKFTSPYLKNLKIKNSNFNGLEEGLLSALFTLNNLKALRFFNCPELCNDFVKNITHLKERSLLSILVFLNCYSLTGECVYYLKELKETNVKIYNCENIIYNNELSLLINQHAFIDCECVSKSSKELFDKQTGKWNDYLEFTCHKSLNEEELFKELIINLSIEKNYTLALKYIDDFLFTKEMSLKNELIYIIYFYETMCLVKTKTIGNDRYFENLPLVYSHYKNHKYNEKLVKFIVELLKRIETTKQFFILSNILIDNGKHYSVFINYSVLENVPYEEEYVYDLLNLFELVIDSINFLHFEENDCIYYDFITFLKSAFMDVMEDASILFSKCYFKFANTITLKLNNELRLQYLNEAKNYDPELDINDLIVLNEDLSLKELIKKEYPQVEVVSRTITIPNEKLQVTTRDKQTFYSDKFIVDGFSWCISLELLGNEEFFKISLSLESILKNNDTNTFITKVTPFHIILMINGENLVCNPILNCYNFSAPFTSLKQKEGGLFPLACLQPFEKTEKESIFKFDIALKILRSNVYSFHSYWENNSLSSILLDIPITTLTNSKRGMKFYSDPFEAFGLLWNLVFYPKGLLTSEQIISLRLDSEKNESIEKVEIFYFISSGLDFNEETTFTGRLTVPFIEECINSYSNQKGHEIKQVFFKDGISFDRYIFKVGLKLKNIVYEALEEEMI